MKKYFVNEVRGSKYLTGGNFMKRIRHILDTYVGSMEAIAVKKDRPMPVVIIEHGRKKKRLDGMSKGQKSKCAG